MDSGQLDAREADTMISNSRQTLLALSLVVVLVALAAPRPASAAEPETTGPAQRDLTAPAQTDAHPSVTIASDKTTAFRGDTITLTVRVFNFILDATLKGQANAAGIGHYHIYLDDARGGDYMATSVEPTVQVQLPVTISDGTHILKVVLRNNDHSPIAPSAEDTIAIIVGRH